MSTDHAEADQHVHRDRTEHALPTAIRRDHTDVVMCVPSASTAAVVVAVQPKINDDDHHGSFEVASRCCAAGEAGVERRWSGSAAESEKARKEIASATAPKTPGGYVIEPPDILLVEYARPDMADPVKITGQRLVYPDGAISRGQPGSVLVGGEKPRLVGWSWLRDNMYRTDNFPGRSNAALQPRCRARNTTRIKPPATSFMHIPAARCNHLPAQGRERAIHLRTVQLADQQDSVPKPLRLLPTKHRHLRSPATRDTARCADLAARARSAAFAVSSTSPQDPWHQAPTTSHTHSCQCDAQRN